jgi:hypothetical protein
MTSRYFSGVLIILLSLVFNTPLEAGDVGSDAKLAAQSAAGVALYAAAAVAVVLVVIHYSKKRTVTGCVSAGADGATVTDESDRHIYMLSGNTSGITAGNRLKLRGKKKRLKGSDQVVWEAKNVVKDFGVCHP